MRVSQNNSAIISVILWKIPCQIDREEKIVFRNLLASLIQKTKTGITAITIINSPCTLIISLQHDIFIYATNHYVTLNLNCKNIPNKYFNTHCQGPKICMKISSMFPKRQKVIKPVRWKLMAERCLYRNYWPVSPQISDK